MKEMTKMLAVGGTRTGATMSRWASGAAVAVVLCMNPTPSLAIDAKDTLVVAGPRTPESLDQEYPPTESSQEPRRNIYERLLQYASKTEGGIQYEDLSKLEGALAESWELASDRQSITFKLRKGVLSSAGNELTADSVMWSFQRGWEMNSSFRWYMTQILNIEKFDSAFSKVDDYTVKVTVPKPSALLDRIWANSDLGIIDATEVKKQLSTEDPWGAKWLGSHSASFSPYYVSKYSPGQEVVYDANEHYYRGVPKLKRVIFREMPASANRVAALQAGSIDVAENLLPREQAFLEKVPSVKVWEVFGNYIHRVEMNNTMKPFTDKRVRQAMNYLVPRDAILKAVYFGTARITKSPISEVYPGFTDQYYHYDTDLAKAKALLAEAGLPNGFKTELAYRTGDQIEEEIAVILKSSFAKAGIEVSLTKLPASTYVERYMKGEIPMFFIRDMAIVPDAAYVANLWLNSKSLLNYSRFKNDEVDSLINDALAGTDEAKRLKQMERVQAIVMDEAPWVFLFNPGYQLTTRANVGGFSWYTPNGNAWFDFHKQ